MEIKGQTGISMKEKKQTGRYEVLQGFLMQSVRWLRSAFLR